jgi:hypothetical protein
MVALESHLLVHIFVAYIASYGVFYDRVWYFSGRHEFFKGGCLFGCGGLGGGMNGSQLSLLCLDGSPAGSPEYSILFARPVELFAGNSYDGLLADSLMFTFTHRA